MKKSDLKTGMLVVTEFNKFIVFKDHAILDKDYDMVCIYIKDGEYTGWDAAEHAFKGEMIKVYTPNNGMAMLDYRKEYFNISNWILLWERTPEKTYKLDGVEYSESTLRSLIQKATE